MTENSDNNARADRRQILKDSAHYLTSTIVAQCVSMLRTMLLPVLLVPAQLGIWNLMNVIVGYGANAHLGLLHGFNKKVPAIRTVGNADDFNELKDSVFWCNLLLGLAIGSGLFVASLVMNPIYASALRIISLVVVLQMFFVFYFSLLRADNKFSLVSNGIAGLSIFSSILVLLLAYFSMDRLLGALTGMLAAYPLVIGYWYHKGGYRFKLRLRWLQIKDSFRIGLPLIILGLIDMVLLSMDRWIIVWRLPDSELGFYALGIMACNLLGLVPTAAANVLYPRMLARFASSHDQNEVGSLMLHPIRAISVIMIFLISIGTIFIPMIVNLLLPKYMTAIPLIQILVPGAFFLAIAPIAGSYVVTVNRQMELIKLQLAAMIICLMVDVILLSLGYGVRGVAYGTICCYAIYGIGYVGIAVYLTKGKIQETILFLLHLCVLFGVMASSLKITDMVIPVGIGWSAQILFATIRLIIVVGIMLPFVWFVNRKNDLLSIIQSEFTSWRAAKKSSL